MNPEFAGSQYVIEIIYLIASALFILSLKWMSSPATARHEVAKHNRGIAATPRRWCRIGTNLCP